VVGGIVPYGFGKKGRGNNQKYTIPNGCNGEVELPLIIRPDRSHLRYFLGQGIFHSIYGRREVCIVGVGRREREDMESQSF